MRTQWQRYAMIRWLGAPRLAAPHPISRIHLEGRFTSAYCRFGGPVALMIERAVLGSDGPFYFSDKV
eukprot:3875772-Prymnesium_polylepis.1